MKGRIIMGLLVLPLMLSITIGCVASCGTATPLATEPPSEEELREQNFLLPEIPRITCYQLKQMMDKGDELILVDVRRTNMYDLGHLPNAMNIPHEPEESLITKIQKLPKDRLIVFYCD